MRHSSRLLPFLMLPFLACSSDPEIAPPPPPNPPPIVSTTDADPPGEADVPLVPASKVDLLFVVDNSASMGDKAGILSKSVDSLLRRLVGEKKITDIHVGIISTSLGAAGGDVCPTGGRYDDRGHLLGSGVLSVAKSGSVDSLVADTQKEIIAVGETGCGLEAQLESMYRFLVQPDPPQSIRLDAKNVAVLEGVDYELLAQRKAFLRPDSALAIVMLTDEDDSSPDPRSLKGQGWAFAARSFPGSTTFRGDARNGTTAPRATSACSVDPASADCTSCALVPGTTDSECAKNGGFYAADEDNLNVRFHRMKQRFGVDPRFPVARYSDALTTRRVPDRGTDHDAEGRYVHAATCTNPIFAAALPEKQGDEICRLKEGARSRQLVTFHLIGGLPPGLAGKRASEIAWTKVLGGNPDAYDTTGIDPHMIQSVAPRAGLPAPSATRGDNGTDPVHGREWDTRKDDLQYACTFVLPTPRACTAQDPSCDCAQDDRSPPLCGATSGEQVRGKAYPTIQELRVAKALGERAVVSSICAVDAQRGYGAALDLLVERMTPVLAN